jgi:F-type H+-transporting ATPase subunit alpha
MLMTSDASTRYLLNRGARLTELLKQPQFSPMPTEIMAPLVYAGVNGLLDKVDTNQITAWEKSL